MSSDVVSCPSCGARNRVPVAAKGHPRCAKCPTDLPWLVAAGDPDFAAAVDTDVLVVVDLWAPWCGPCRMVAPALEELARRYAGRLKVVKVDVDRAPGVARRFDARSIPLLMFLRGGQVVDSVVGAQPLHALQAKVDSLLQARARH
jgi:thioredoxin 2